MERNGKKRSRDENNIIGDEESGEADVMSNHGPDEYESNSDSNSKDANQIAINNDSSNEDNRVLSYMNSSEEINHDTQHGTQVSVMDTQEIDSGFKFISFAGSPQKSEPVQESDRGNVVTTPSISSAKEVDEPAVISEKAKLRALKFEIPEFEELEPLPIQNLIKYPAGPAGDIARFILASNKPNTAATIADAMKEKLSKSVVTKALDSLTLSKNGDPPLVQIDKKLYFPSQDLFPSKSESRDINDPDKHLQRHHVIRLHLLWLCWVERSAQASIKLFFICNARSFIYHNMYEIRNVNEIVFLKFRTSLYLLYIISTNFFLFQERNKGLRA